MELGLNWPRAGRPTPGAATMVSRLLGRFGAHSRNLVQALRVGSSAERLRPSHPVSQWFWAKALAASSRSKPQSVIGANCEFREDLFLLETRHAPRPHHAQPRARHRADAPSRARCPEHLALAAASKRLSDLEPPLRSSGAAPGRQPTEAGRALVRHIRSLHASLYALETEVMEFSRGIRAICASRPTPVPLPSACRRIW